MGWSLMVVTCMDFNPRSPDGERLAHRLSNVSLMTLFQSTLPGWGATKDGTRHPCPPPISIHAPRMGSDCSPGAIVVAMSEFQSTLPGWGATHVASESRGRRFDFNPRSPDGERRFDAHDGAHEGGISIHAPRMGSDRATEGPARSQLTISIHAPRMGSDLEKQIAALQGKISIHAPRMGSDPQSATNAPSRYISIHAPRMGSDD